MFRLPGPACSMPGIAVALFLGFLSRYPQPGLVDDEVFLMQSSMKFARYGAVPNPETEQDDSEIEPEHNLQDSQRSSTAKVDVSHGPTWQDIKAVFNLIENDSGMRSRNPWFWSTLILAVLLVFGVGASWLDTLLSRHVEKTLEAGIKTFHKSVLGVEVDIDTISSAALQGSVFIDKVVIRNPKGHGFESDYVLQVRKVTADFSLWSLIRSRGRRVQVEAIMFKDVEIMFEKSLSTSNLDRTLDLMGMGNVISLGAKSAAHEGTQTQGALYLDASTPLKELCGTTPCRLDMKILRLGVSNIGAQTHVQTRSSSGHPQRDIIADVVYSDFIKEFGLSRVDDVFRALMKNVLDKAILNRKAKTLPQWL